MKRLKNTDERANILYTAVGMTGLSFILFLALDHSVISYLIDSTVTEAGCAICDIFWYSILFEMLEMTKSPARIMSVGFSALMIGVLFGKIIADSDPAISGLNLSIVSMAVICITLFIIPVLHKLLSKMIKKSAIVSKAEVNPIDFPDGIDALTEREKQVAALLLKGRTSKLIAAELYLSENTVKTHIKSIYSKFGIKKKSELFSFMMGKTIES
jgi:DNA-binding CsgD family transcriptional regulator